LVFVNVNENLIMANDVVTPSNPPVLVIEKEEVEEASVNINVSQRSHKEEPSRRVVRTRVDRSA